MSLASPLQKLAGFQEEVQFEVLRCLYLIPRLSKCTLVKDLGVGFGGINFCFRALVEKGLLKIQNFSQSKKKLRYAYFLTSAGVAEKSNLTAEFLKCKLAKYEMLQADTKVLKAELNPVKASSQ